MTQNRRSPTAALWLPLAAVAWAAAPAAAQVIPEPTPVGHAVANQYFQPTYAAGVCSAACLACCHSNIA